MRKAFALILGVILALSLGGCNYDLYSGKRPYDYGAAKWVCEEASVWFTVDPDAKEYYSPEGEIQIGDQTKPCKLFFIHQTDQVSLTILKTERPNDNELYDGELEGVCTFSPDRLVIKVDTGNDTIFGGKYEELIFVRTPIE